MNKSYYLTKEEIDALNHIIWDRMKFHDQENYEECHSIILSSQVLNYPRGEAFGKLNMGYYFLFYAKINSAKETMKEALAMFDKLNDLEGMERCYNALGIIESRLGNSMGALENFEKNYHIVKELGNHERIGSSYNNLALTYRELKNYNQALEYYEKALEIYHDSWKPGDTSSKMRLYNISIAYFNLGELLIDMGNLQRATQTLEEGLAFAKQYDIIISQMHIYQLFGRIKDELDHEELAEKYYIAAYDIAQVTNDPKDIIEVYFHLGKHYIKWNKKEKALYHLERVLEKNHDSDSRINYNETLELLIDLCRDLNKPSELMKYSKLLSKAL